MIRVMVVDDSRLTRISLKTTLQGAPSVQWVGEAEEGRQALELVSELKPEVILMDIGMPIMDGIKTTQTIRERYPDMKIIMMTSHEADKDVLDAFQSGATSYCLKDTSPEILLQVIESTANGACWIDPKVARVLVQQVSRPAASAPGARQPASEEDLVDDLTEIPNMFSLLSEREIEVLKLITQGQNNTEISEHLGISMNTVKTHVKNIFQKLAVEDRTAAALKAIKERIV